MIYFVSFVQHFVFICGSVIVNLTTKYTRDIS